jgi:hypothetical protein
MSSKIPLKNLEIEMVDEPHLGHFGWFGQWGDYDTF